MDREFERECNVAATQGRHDWDLLFEGPIFLDIVLAEAPEPVAGTEVFARDMEISPGGVANLAVAGARLGARTKLVSDVGDDALGQLMLTALRGEDHLDVSSVLRRDGRTSVTVVLTNSSDRSFITYQELGLDSTSSINAGSVGSAYVPLDAIPNWAPALRSAGTRLVAGIGWDSSGRLGETLLTRLAEVDVFVSNSVEAMACTRESSPHLALQALASAVPLAVVTLGSTGVIAMDSSSGKALHVNTPVVAAADTTGAGDVFTAALMVAMAEDWPLEEKLRFAGLCASLSVRALGGAVSAPRIRDIRRFLDEDAPEGEWSHISAWAQAREALPNTDRLPGHL